MNPRFSLLAVGLALICTAPLAAQQMATTAPPRVERTERTDLATQNLMTVAASAGEFHTFLRAVDAAGLTDTLQEPGPYMVLAPTDAAFAALPPGALDRLMADKDRLTMVMLHHISAQVRTSADLRTRRETLISMDGKPLKVRDGVDGANVVDGDLKAGNGVIHGVDRVLGLGVTT